MNKVKFETLETVERERESNNLNQKNNIYTKTVI